MYMHMYIKGQLCTICSLLKVINTYICINLYKYAVWQRSPNRLSQRSFIPAYSSSKAIHMYEGMCVYKCIYSMYIVVCTFTAEPLNN